MKSLMTCTYSSSNVIRVTRSRRMRWAEHVTRMGDRRSVYGVLVGKAEERRPLGRPGHRWEDNVTMGLQEVGWLHGLGDFFGLGQGQVAVSCESGNEPSGSIKCGEFLD
jgi:hypothetical protein